jgi:hypothetical protein
MKRHKIYLAALLMSGLAVYSGKYFSSGTYKSTTMQKCQYQNENKTMQTNLWQIALENINLISR